MPLSILYGTTATVTCNQSVENAPFFCSQGRNYTSDRLPVCKWISLLLVSLAIQILSKKEIDDRRQRQGAQCAAIVYNDKVWKPHGRNIGIFSIKFTRLFLSAHT